PRQSGTPGGIVAQALCGCRRPRRGPGQVPRRTASGQDHGPTSAAALRRDCGKASARREDARCAARAEYRNPTSKDIPAYPYCSAALCMVQSMNRRGFGGGGAMARNLVQFQKGLSEQEFDRLYGTEELCRAVVIGARWPDGFECPACGGRKHSVIKSRGLFQCSGCRRQTSPTAGTIFASTKLTLRQWFRAMYHMTQSKKG